MRLKFLVHRTSRSICVSLEKTKGTVASTLIIIVIHGTIYRVVPAGPVPSAFGSYDRGERHDFENATLRSNTTQTVTSNDRI
jgi:hypothetical protein